MIDPGLKAPNHHPVSNFDCEKDQQCFQFEPLFVVELAPASQYTEVIGKIGTDIKDNKCSWLVVQALKKCTPAQKKIIEDNYGKDDKACEAKIKALYVELNIEAVYKKYEEESYQNLKAIIEGQKVLPQELFSSMLAKIYKRQK